MRDTAKVTSKGFKRWQAGHPWIYRSDVSERPECDAGVVRVLDNRNRPLGWALWSPRSEISLRLLDSDPGAIIDADWWHERIAAAAARRISLETVTNAYRVVHGEADGCPSLICDRYDRWAVVQLMSAGLEAFRDEIVEAIVDVTRVEGILARNDVPLRSKEGLPRETVVLHGEVPQEIEVDEYELRYLAAPWTGQKTGAFLDQRENRRMAGEHARGRALDAFSYHGSFAMHLARNADDRHRSRFLRSGAGARASRTPISTDSPTSSSSRQTRSTICASARRREHAIRHDRARSAGVRENPRVAARVRSAVTRRSICARCGCLPPEECCTRRAAAFM